MPGPGTSGEAADQQNQGSCAGYDAPSLVALLRNDCGVLRFFRPFQLAAAPDFPKSLL